MRCSLGAGYGALLPRTLAGTPSHTLRYSILAWYTGAGRRLVLGVAQRLGLPLDLELPVRLLPRAAMCARREPHRRLLPRLMPHGAPRGMPRVTQHSCPRCALHAVHGAPCRGQKLEARVRPAARRGGGTSQQCTHHLVLPRQSDRPPCSRGLQGLRATPPMSEPTRRAVLQHAAAGARCNGHRSVATRGCNRLVQHATCAARAAQCRRTLRSRSKARFARARRLGVVRAAVRLAWCWSVTWVRVA